MDLFGKITEGRNLLEKIGSKIPGYSGYKEREDRRQADRILRQTIAARYEEQWARISGLQRQLLEEGGIEHVDRLEAAAIKLRTFVDQVKTASYGYSGFFDAVKVNEKELAALYDFDNQLLQNIEAVKAAVDNVEASLSSDGLPAAARHLTSLAQECNETFEKRNDVLTASN